MATRLSIEQLCASHLSELASELRHPEVYKHIGGVPPLEDFILDRERALAGPTGASTDEIWLNYLVREQVTNAMVGRLEATVHDGIAEVAFLFGPSHWGKGFAFEGLSWLHTEVSRLCGVSHFWATTVPANVRSQALLRRSGYREVLDNSPLLYSYEPGDLVFSWFSAAK